MWDEGLGLVWDRTNLQQIALSNAACGVSNLFFVTVVVYIRGKN